MGRAGSLCPPLTATSVFKPSEAARFLGSESLSINHHGRTGVTRLTFRALNYLGSTLFIAKSADVGPWRSFSQWTTSRYSCYDSANRKGHGKFMENAMSPKCPIGMKSLSLVSIAVALLLATGCGTIRQDNSAVTTLQLSGPPGSPFSGYLVKYGERVKVSNVTPWTYQSQGITGFEFRKADRKAAMDLQTFYDQGNAAHSTQSLAIPAGVLGFRGSVMNHALEMEIVP
jgi:hypothetical protein